MAEGTDYEALLALGQSLQGLSNMTHNFTEVLKQADGRIVIRWKGKALHSGEAFGIPATNRTVYFNGHDICKVKQGDTVLVSGAAGSVGSMAGYVAKALGCSILVGIAGGPEKCKLLTEKLGYDHAIDYKADGLYEKLDTYFPNGIDVFFDNVGGELLDEVLARINRRARIAICGRISEYLIPPEEYHLPKNMYRIGLKDAKMEGFFVYDYQDDYPKYEKQLAQWIRNNQLKPHEDIGISLEEMPNALISLYKGTNGGTRMVKVAL